MTFVGFERRGQGFAFQLQNFPSALAFYLGQSFRLGIEPAQDQSGEIAKYGQYDENDSEAEFVREQRAEIGANRDGSPDGNVFKRPFKAGPAAVNVVGEQDAPCRHGHRVGQPQDELNQIDMPRQGREQIKKRYRGHDERAGYDKIKLIAFAIGPVHKAG